MPFESIENAKPSQENCPSDGLRVCARKMAKKGGGEATRYIRIQVGKDLANKLVWRNDEIKVDVAFGTGNDAGHIRMAIDEESGGFVAKKDSRGRYSMTINEHSCNGLFALEFPAFSRSGVQARSVTGKPPFVIFEASPEMLAVEDD